MRKSRRWPVVTRRCLRRIAAAGRAGEQPRIDRVDRHPQTDRIAHYCDARRRGPALRLPDSERFVLTASVLELSNGFLRNFDIRARGPALSHRTCGTDGPERASGGARPAGNGRHRCDSSALRRARVAAGSGRADRPVPDGGRACVSCSASAHGATDADRERADRIRRRLAEHHRRIAQAASMTSANSASRSRPADGTTG